MWWLSGFLVGTLYELKILYKKQLAKSMWLFSILLLASVVQCAWNIDQWKISSRCFFWCAYSRYFSRNLIMSVCVAINMVWSSSIRTVCPSSMISMNSLIIAIVCTNGLVVVSCITYEQCGHHPSYVPCWSYYFLQVCASLHICACECQVRAIKY